VGRDRDPGRRRAHGTAGAAPEAPPAAPAPVARAAVAPAAPAPGGALATAERLLRALVERRGSDLHLRVGEPPVVRASGELERLDEPPMTAAQLEAVLVALMPERNRAEYAECGDTDFAYEIAGCARFRANALRDRLGPPASSA
jgi:twitching motility protein PilT